MVVALPVQRLAIPAPRDDGEQADLALPTAQIDEFEQA
jgi:hypothetical protein